MQQSHPSKVDFVRSHRISCVCRVCVLVVSKLYSSTLVLVRVLAPIPTIVILEVSLKIPSEVSIIVISQL